MALSPSQRIGERLRARAVAVPSGCWLVTASHGRGYGQAVGLSGGSELAHRVAYEVWVGPIPEGMNVDHVCHNDDESCTGGVGCQHRRCVNPAHLEVVTPTENKRRGRAGQIHALRQMAKTHCPYGHPYDSENTYRHPSSNRRSCRICKADADRRAKAKRREAA